MTTPRNGGESKCWHLYVTSDGICKCCGQLIHDAPWDRESTREMAADLEYDALREENLI